MFGPANAVCLLFNWSLNQLASWTSAFLIIQSSVAGIRFFNHEEIIYHPEYEDINGEWNDQDDQSNFQLGTGRNGPKQQVANFIPQFPTQHQCGDQLLYQQNQNVCYALYGPVMKTRFRLPVLTEDEPLVATSYGNQHDQLDHHIDEQQSDRTVKQKTDNVECAWVGLRVCQ